MKSLNIDPDEVVSTADFVLISTTVSMTVSMERLSTRHQRSMSLRGLEQAITALVHASAFVHQEAFKWTRTDDKKFASQMWSCLKDGGLSKGTLKIIN